MDDKEKIKLLEKQIELLEKVVELQKLTPIIVTPIVTKEVYPFYPSYPSYPQPWVVPYYGTGDPFPQSTWTCGAIQ